tara:strand:- start:892 stop:1002 length:111 start_codon:yes stop_codon:yes gene_type:complete
MKKEINKLRTKNAVATVKLAKERVRLKKREAKNNEP